MGWDRVSDGLGQRRHCPDALVPGLLWGMCDGTVHTVTAHIWTENWVGRKKKTGFFSYFCFEVCFSISCRKGALCWGLGTVDMVTPGPGILGSG